MSRVFLLISLMLIADTALAYNTKCAYERSRLKSIQNAMRTIYNSQNIIEEEQRRYATYRNCMENGKTNKLAKSYKAKKKQFPVNSRTGINSQNSYQSSAKSKFKANPRTSSAKRSYQKPSSNKRKIEK